MDVLTEPELRVGASAAASRWPLYAAALAYAVVVFTAVAHHHDWVDEAQSWLLARDAGLFDLWTRLLHYEGSPGLWHTLLHLLARAGLPYGGLNVFSGLLGCAAACILLARAPFPAALRIALPFTFFLCYQYAVIARSYDLLPLLLFCCAAMYSSAASRPWLFTVLLCLIAAVSVHGMVLAFAIAVSMWSSRGFRLPAVNLVCFAALMVLFAAAARPAPDGTFIPGLNFSFEHFLDIGGKALATAFTGEWISSLVVIALSIPLLWRGGGWLFFMLAGTLLCGVASAVYSQVWHHGILFLAWLFALWISWASPKVDRLSIGMAVASLSMVAALQCYWTFCSMAYERGHAYSGSRAAATGIGELHRDGRKLDAIGYATTAIQPYFAHNIFANVNDGRPEAYWDWSQRNHVNEDSRRLAELQPDYVIVGYKNEFERGLWTDLVRRSGYRAIGHYEGNSFWQTRVLEPESYDLYQRSDAP